MQTVHHGQVDLEHLLMFSKAGFAGPTKAIFFEINISSSRVYLFAKRFAIASAERGPLRQVLCPGCDASPSVRFGEGANEKRLL